MCGNCGIIAALFDAAGQEPHQNYVPVLRFLEAMERKGRVELYAGDCSLSETLDMLDDEKHFTLCQYLRCTQCGQFFFLGACVRGKPKFKIIEDIALENPNNLLWGQVGTKYHNN
jgi:hypothetical protein